MSRRTQRVEDLVRSELAQLLLREVGDPRVRLASVSNVKVSPDLKHASILVSVLGEEKDRLACLAALQNARGFIRARLAKHLKGMRSIPDLSFELDRGAEYSQRISDLLENLNDHDEST